MKKYLTPDITIIDLLDSDVITSSSGFDDIGNLPLEDINGYDDEGNAHI